MEACAGTIDGTTHKVLIIHWDTIHQLTDGYRNHSLDILADLLALQKYAYKI